MESLDETPEEGRHISPALLRDWREVPSEALGRQEVRQMLQDTIGNLSPLYREVLLLRDAEEFSIEETATALAITIGTVKVPLHRARIMMQRDLAPKLKNAAPYLQRSSTRVWTRGAPVRPVETMIVGPTTMASANPAPNIVVMYSAQRTGLSRGLANHISNSAPKRKRARYSGQSAAY